MKHPKKTHKAKSTRTTRYYDHGGNPAPGKKNKKLNRNVEKELAKLQCLERIIISVDPVRYEIKFKSPVQNPA